MGTNRRKHTRSLVAEQLERRELLAANLACPVEALPVAPQSETVFVESQPSNGSGYGVDTPLNQRERTDENSDTGVGRQKRPRDRDVEDVTTTTEATRLRRPSPSVQGNR